MIKERFCGGAERQGGSSLLAKCLPSNPLTTAPRPDCTPVTLKINLWTKLVGARQGPIKKCTEGWCHMASAAGSEIALQGGRWSISDGLWCKIRNQGRLRQVKILLKGCLVHCRHAREVQAHIIWPLVRHGRSREGLALQGLQGRISDGVWCKLGPR